MTFVFSALLEYALVNYALRANRTYFRLRGIDFRHYNDDGEEDEDGEDHDGDGGGFGGAGGAGGRSGHLFDEEMRGRNRKRGRKQVRRSIFRPRRHYFTNLIRQSAASSCGGDVSPGGGDDGSPKQVFLGAAQPNFSRQESTSSGNLLFVRLFINY